METIGTWWMWAGFAVFVVVAIAIDLLVMERQGAHKVTMKEAVRWSLLWFGLAFVFVALLWWYLDSSQGREVANTVSMQFITGYLVEKSLSVDNSQAPTRISKVRSTMAPMMPMMSARFWYCGGTAK